MQHDTDMPDPGAAEGADFAAGGPEFGEKPTYVLSEVEFPDSVPANVEMKLLGFNSLVGSKALVSDSDFIYDLGQNVGSALDQRRGGEPLFIAISDLGVFDKVCRLQVDGEGSVKVDFGRVVQPSGVRLTAPIEAVTPAGRRVAWGLFDELQRSYDDEERFPAAIGSNNDLPQIDELYVALGFIRSDNGYIFPAPSVFKERLERIREEYSGPLYIPEVKLVEHANIQQEEAIPVSQYLEVFAEGKVPVDASSLEFYFHDMAADHFQGLEVYGQPLMDLCAEFAKAALGSDADSLLTDKTILDYVQQWHDNGGEIKTRRSARKRLQEAQRDGYIDREKEAGKVIDTVTGVFGDSSIRANEVSSPDIEITAESHNNHMQIMVDTLRAAGTLGDTEVVKSLIETGQIQDDSEVTGAMLTGEIVRLARDRLGVEQQAA